MSERKQAEMKSMAPVVRPGAGLSFELSLVTGLAELWGWEKNYVSHLARSARIASLCTTYERQPTKYFNITPNCGCEISKWYSGSVATHSTVPQSARMDRSLEAIQAQIEQCESSLRSLQSSSAPVISVPSTDSRDRFQQLGFLKVAYDAPREPSLPPSESPLSALLALRSASVCARETQICIATSESESNEIQQQLERESNALRDAELIRLTLSNRIEQLRARLNAQSQQLPASMARDLVRAMSRHRQHCDVETGKLIGAFNDFIDESLAMMLAVEERGGPIVGEQHVYTNECAPRSSRFPITSAKLLQPESNAVARQLRMDEIWGPVSLDQQQDVSLRHRQVAGADMRHLTEQLLNNLVGINSADGHFSSEYLELQRESAAARFLVRSKVAHFQFANATRIRLYDFANKFN